MIPALLLSVSLASSAINPTDTLSKNPALLSDIDTNLMKSLLPQVNILESQDKLLNRTPGSATYLNEKTLKTIAPISGNEVLRKVAGVHVVDEEGVGMRANIGIRGLDPSRSAKVLILEDGIPVALNPYGEPELYYTPNMDRMAGIEVLKGSGQILFGPQTIGGVINYITPDPTEEQLVSLNLRGGQGGLFSSSLLYSNTFGNTGVLLQYNRKQADRVGYVGFQIDDVMAKLRIKLNNKSYLGIKTAFYNESSDATYIGLTQTMFDQGGQDFAQMAPFDHLAVRRMSFSATHTYLAHEKLSFKTTAYTYTTTRNWRRQDFSINTLDENGDITGPPVNHTGITWGNPNIARGAVYMRNSNGHRNRQFEVAGLESRAEYKTKIFSRATLIEAGARYQFEKAYEQRVNGQIAEAISGSLVNDESRWGHAASAFAQARMYLSPKVQLIPGIRLENYQFTREIYRNNFGSIGIRDTLIIGENQTGALIPGMSLQWQSSKNAVVFAGIHRGFAPPRLKDAIDNQGGVVALDAELSWNSEMGIRWSPNKNFFAELTAFHMDFSNQIIPVAEAAGGAGAGLVNAGRSSHTGAEAALNINLLAKSSEKHLLWLNTNATFVRATFAEDRFKNGQNLIDNRLPYAPEWLLNAGLTYEWNKLSMMAHLTYVSEQFADELNTIIPNPDGRTGLIEAYKVIDLSANYQVNKYLGLMLSVRNLTNERYIASRRPQGIRLGLPRYIMGGVNITL